jgi:cytochrome c oxidase subunit 1
LLVTRAHDAEPDHVSPDPGPTIWPFWSAVTVTLLFVGSIFTPWALVWGAIPVSIALIGWFWPKRDEVELMRRTEVKPDEAQPPVWREATP